MMPINVLRAFKPHATSFGTNFPNYNNGLWSIQADTVHTHFVTTDQIVTVIFSPNDQWGCTEISFRTVLLNKVRDESDVLFLSSYIPDIDMPTDPNRGTDVFRKVVYLLEMHLDKYRIEKVGFTGATPYLDRVYGRLCNLPYVHHELSQHCYGVEKLGRDLFFILIT